MMRLLVLVGLGLYGCGAAGPESQLSQVAVDPPAGAERLLAERFAPIVHLHPQEKYLPMDLGEYYAHLNDTKDEAFFTSGRAAFARGGVKAVVAQVSADQRRLQYWLFYPKNGCQGVQIDFRPWDWWRRRGRQQETFSLCNLAIHEGDWEHVTVELTADLAAVNRVFLSQHSGGVWLDAAQMTIEDGHVQVYAALNSHANYPSAEAFHSQTVVSTPILAALTWIDAVRIGDIVSLPTSSTKASSPMGSLRWDTSRGLTVWNEGNHDSFRDYLGGWGHPLRATEVSAVNELPAYLAAIVRTVVPVAFAVVPRLRQRGVNEAPPSPWGRRSWREFDQ